MNKQTCLRTVLDKGEDSAESNRHTPRADCREIGFILSLRNYPYNMNRLDTEERRDCVVKFTVL